MAVLCTHTGVRCSEYKDMQTKLNNASTLSNIIILEDISIHYGDSGVFIVKDDRIKEDSFVSVYYKDPLVASECGLQALVSDTSIRFVFDVETSDDIICTIIITQNGGV